MEKATCEKSQIVADKTVENLLTGKNSTTETLTEAEAQAWIEAHPNNADVVVTTRCTTCGAEDWFWHSDLGYGPVGDVNEQSDYCGHNNCKGQDAETVSIRIEGKEVDY